MNNGLNLALNKASRNLCIDRETVEMVYRSYWKFIRNHLSTYSLKNISEEDFNKLTTNFNIPYIGKLYTTYEQVNRYKRRVNYYRNVKAKENKANRQSGSGDKESV